MAPRTSSSARPQTPTSPSTPKKSPISPSKVWKKLTGKRETQDKKKAVSKVNFGKSKTKAGKVKPEEDEEKAVPEGLGDEDLGMTFEDEGVMEIEEEEKPKKDRQVKREEYRAKQAKKEKDKKRAQKKK